jgi:hypothetical protein
MASDDALFRSEILGHQPLSVATGVFNIGQLMALTNESESGDQGVTLLHHLTSLAEGIKVFPKLGYLVSELAGVRDQLVQLDTFTLKQLGANGHLFYGESPTWPFQQAPSSRKLALFLFDFLNKAEQAIVDNDFSHSPGGEKSGDRSGRHITRKRKRHRRHRSSGSSTSSSEKARIKSDDSSTIIERSDFKIFGFDTFPDPKIVTKVARLGAIGGHVDTAYLSSLPLEDWVPSYYGANLPSTVKKKYIKERRERETTPCSFVMENITAFWITHGLAGFVTVLAVFKHLVIMNRVNSEHGARHAMQYFRSLVGHIKEEMILNKISSFDSYITRIIPEVETACNIIMSRSKNVRTDTEPGTSKNANASTKARWDRGDHLRVPRPQSVPARSQGKGKGKFKDLGDNEPTVVGPQPVCRFHHPKESKVCLHGTQCTFAHVDTNQPDGLRRYLAARGKGSGK